MSEEYLETKSHAPNELEYCSEYTVLEALLSYCVPGDRAASLAHTLIDEFGSLIGVLDTEPEKLMHINGIGENAAILLNMMPSLAKRYLIGKTDDKNLFLGSEEEIMRHISNQFIGSAKEKFKLFFFDENGKYIGCSTLRNGSVDSVTVNMREIAEEVLNNSAHGVILAHNHPGSVATPSNDDIGTTKEIVKLLTAIGITVHDHIIVSDTSTISMRSIDKLRPLFESADSQ